MTNKGNILSRGPISWYNTRTTPLTFPAISYFFPSYLAPYVACSVRILSKDALYCMKVRRSSDDTTKDIWWDNYGGLNVEVLEDFCNGGNGYVDTWYGQGGAPDYSQANFDRQPQICATGSTIMVNGKPALQFDGVDDILGNTQSLGSDPGGEWSYQGVFKIDDNSVNNSLWAPSGSGCGILTAGTSFYKFIIVGLGTNTTTAPVDTDQELITAQLHVIGLPQLYQFHISHGGVAPSWAWVTNGTSGSYIGGHAISTTDAPINSMSGKYQEHIIWNSAYFSDRSVRINHINNYFGVY